MSIILNSKMNLKNCEWKSTSKRENFWEIFQLIPFVWKILVEITHFKKQHLANFDLFSFSVPREEIRSVTDCKRTRKPRNTRSFPNNDNQGSSSAGNIHHPELQNAPKKLRMKNYKRARELLRDIPIYTFCLKNISRDNAIQKTIICQFWLIFFFSPTRRDLQCNRLQTNRKATQHEVISQQRQPRIIIRR